MKHNDYPAITITPDADGKPVFRYLVSSPFQDTLAGVLQYLKQSEGFNNAQLAHWLGLAQRTVENYLQGRVPQMSVVFLIQNRLSELVTKQATCPKRVSSLPMPTPERSESGDVLPTKKATSTRHTTALPEKSRTTNVPRGTCTASVATKRPVKASGKGGAK